MDASYSELLARVAEVYRRALDSEPRARQWLAGKGLDDLALLERFGVGWSGGALSSMARGEIAEQLRALGLTDSQGRDRFVGCVIVPVRDPDGRVVQMAAYSMEGTLAWLFPEDTPAFWNDVVFRAGTEVALAADPLAGLIEITTGRENVVALGGPGKPLGQAAREVLVAHAPQVELRGCDFLKEELQALGIRVRARGEAGPNIPVEEDEAGFAAEFPGRVRFVVQGISQDSLRHLRASVRVLRFQAQPVRSHLDTLDLYHARSRIGFAKTAACILGEDPIVMEQHVARIVTLAEEFLKRRLSAPPAVAISGSDREEALSLLRNPRYPEFISEDLGRVGYVGEDANKQVAYLASISRKLEEPLSILVVSRSAAGKSTLSEGIAGLAPPEDVLRFTRLTAQTLYYQKPDSLRHKMVVIEEEKGVEDAAYALRILQSAKRLSLSTASGKGDARTREVKGPVSLFVTTTRTDLDEETAGRFITLSVDESKEQTRAILAAQRAAEARPPAEHDRLLRLHQNAQRLLAPVGVLNPFAPRLTFPDDRLSARRDHRKYLGLIRAIAFARQHQREVREGAVTVTVEDIALANRLAHHALGQSLYDLTPPSRRLLHELRDWLSERAKDQTRDIRFSQRELREHVGWRKTQLACHLKELLEAEYLVAHVSGPGRRTRYALDWDGQGMDGERFYRGLIDTTTLEPVDTSGSVPGHFRRSSGNRKAAPNGRKDVNSPESPSSGLTSGVKGS